jgi:hypothetical protein
MLRQTLYLIPLLWIALQSASASSVICTLQSGTSGPFVTQNCNQQLAPPTGSLDWGSVLGATATPLTGGTLTTSVAGDGLVVSTSVSDSFEGADNTALVWNGNRWSPAFLVTAASTFAGHFNSASTTTGPPPEPALGDNLLGILDTGAAQPNTTATFTFQQTLTYVEFEVSNVQGTNSNFSAELIAFDSSSNVLGAYLVSDTAGGGVCSGLYNANGPTPCDNAPFVQFYDPQDRIKSVELIMSDPDGAYIDTLEIASESIAPEPSSFAILGVGLLALFWLPKRRKAARD